MTDTQNLPATQEDRHLSQADKQRQRMDALLAAVDQRSAQLKTLLAETGIKYERFVEIFRRALIQSPDLLKADAGSVIKSCIDSATMGLVPDGRLGAIVVYSVNVAPKGKPKNYVKMAQFMPMVQGLLDIAYRSGNFRDIQARVVYEGDDFDYELGIDPWIKHKPARRPARPNGPELEIVAAYAVAKGKDGGVWVEVFEGADIAKVRAVSRATSGPAVGWKEEMTRKGPLRRLWKYLPKNDRMSQLEDLDNDHYDLDLLEQQDAQPERRLSAGFAPRPQPALTQGPDQTIDVKAPTVQREREPESIQGDADEGYEQMMSHGESVAAEPDEKRDIPDTGTYDPIDRVDETPPALKAYEKLLANATNWTQIRKSLQVIIAEENRPTDDDWAATPWFWAWERLEELCSAGGERIDFVTDPLLFECWMIAVEPDEDSVESNWRIVRGTEAFKRADVADRERITRRVEGA